MQDDDPSPFDIAAKKLKDVATKPWEVAQRFWKTREAIKRGILAFHCTEQDLKEAGYLKPWKFMSAAVLLQGGVALAAQKMLFFVADYSPEKEMSLWYWGSSVLLDKTAESVAVYILPLFIAAYVTLHEILLANVFSRPYYTDTERLRVRRLWLYISSTYTFWPTLLISLFNVLQLTGKFGFDYLGIGFQYLFSDLVFRWLDPGDGERDPRHWLTYALEALAFVCVISWGWIFRAYFWKIPTEVLSRLQRKAEFKSIWFKYALVSVVVGAPLGVFMTLLANVACYLLALPIYLLARLLGHGVT